MRTADGKLLGAKLCYAFKCELNAIDGDITALCANVNTSIGFIGCCADETFPSSLLRFRGCGLFTNWME